MDAARTIVTLETIQRTIADALKHAPADRLRIERAAVLIALGRVQRTGIREWTVGSQNNPAAFYLITDDSVCSCEDFQRRRRHCKHLLAAWITRCAERRQELADAATRRARFPGLSAQELHRLSEWKRANAARLEVA